MHQLLSMRVASHAAVDESVVPGAGGRLAVGHRIRQRGAAHDLPRHARTTGARACSSAAATDDERLAAEYSHPVWIIRAFRRALAAEGREDELEALLKADNAAAARQPGRAARPGRASTDCPARSRPVLAVRPRSATAETPPIGRRFGSGRARVQDEGSQLAALALSRARPIRPGERWLDLCAGPGGKAAVLAAEALAGGATLVANELVPARAELVRKALAVFDTPPEVWELDGTTRRQPHPQQFDRILLDAPCTGLGALRRRPEARWRKQPRDVAELAELQIRLLESALAALKPGGILAYVTCSPHPGRDQGGGAKCARDSGGRR